MMGGSKPDLAGVSRQRHHQWTTLSKTIAWRLRHEPANWEKSPNLRFEDGRVPWEFFSNFCRRNHVVQRIAYTTNHDSCAAVRTLVALCQRVFDKGRFEVFFWSGECLAIRAIQGHSAYGVGSRMTPIASGWKQQLHNQFLRFLYHTTGMGEEDTDGRPSDLSPIDRLRLIAAEGLKPGKDAAGNGKQRLHIYFTAINPIEEMAEKAVYSPHVTAYMRISIAASCGEGGIGRTKVAHPPRRLSWSTPPWC